MRERMEEWSERRWAGSRRDILVDGCRRGRTVHCITERKSQCQMRPGRERERKGGMRERVGNKRVGNKRKTERNI